jgi:hypothetical protein
MIKLPSFENKFHFVLGLSALFVASVAAFFSVMGIGMLFSGATISAMIMASSLELGKVVGTTYLYRYWDKTTKMLKTYLCLAIAMLVVITSLGVFGWLSSAYQSSALQYEMSQQQVSTLVVQKDAILNQAEESKQRISEITKLRSDQEARMNDALSSPILSRNPTALRQVQDQNISLINQTDEDLRTERSHYNEFISNSMVVDKKILEAKVDSNKTKDIITFQFVADAFGLDLTTTVKWFIIVIIAVFDPLAVALILAYNVAMEADRKRKTRPVVEEPMQIVELPEPKVEPKIDPPKRQLLNEVPVIVDEELNVVEKKNEVIIEAPIIVNTIEQIQSLPSDDSGSVDTIGGQMPTSDRQMKNPNGVPHLRDCDYAHTPQPGPNRP